MEEAEELVSYVAGLVFCAAFILLGLGGIAAGIWFAIEGHVTYGAVLGLASLALVFYGGHVGDEASRTRKRKHWRWG